VVEEEVYPELLVSYSNPVLAPNEGEANTELQQKIAEMIQEPAFQITLVRLGAQRQKVEVVWIFRELLRQVGLRWR
jgi:hypothetical protein